MSATAFVVICAQALLIQGIFSQCIGRIGPLADDYAANIAYGAGIAPYNYQGVPNCQTSITPTTGGGFLVTSSSPITPTGIIVISENAIEGALAVNGELPFLGAVDVRGSLPTAGAGGINYGCGGAVGIVSESIAPVGPAAPVGLGPYPGLGYGAGLAKRGYGLGIGCGVY